MTLPAGTRLGQYEISAAIGAGGMGKVYRAHDTRLQRQVAIKVLPQLADGDPDRAARFEREAQLLAALNHPNIAQIYGIEESAPSTRAIVMELVEGPTLADRLATGCMPWPEALQLARQIADALDAVHEQGIVHRDLKPANIKVRDDGTVKRAARELGASQRGLGDVAAQTGDRVGIPVVGRLVGDVRVGVDEARQDGRVAEIDNLRAPRDRET